MRQNHIKVFHPNSKKADYIIRHFKEEAVASKASELLGQEAGEKVRSAFRSLQGNGFESLSFRHQGRKIKVELAHAA